MDTRPIQDTHYSRIVYLKILPALVRKKLIGQRLSHTAVQTAASFRAAKNETFSSSAAAAETLTPNCDPPCGQSEAEGALLMKINKSECGCRLGRPPQRRTRGEGDSSRHEIGDLLQHCGFADGKQTQSIEVIA